MNAKKAKSLRRMAEECTIGKPAVTYGFRRREPLTRRCETNSTRGMYLFLKAKLKG